MDKTKGDYEVHVFVCTNEKKGNCCSDNGETIRRELKEWAKDQPGWKKRIRINAAGCLDRCKEGAVVAVYPRNDWCINVKKRDLDEVKALITDAMNASIPAK